MDKKQLDKLIEHSNNTQQKNYDWVRQVISIITGILGFIIALHKKSETEIIHTSYCITLCICGLCILSGLIFLFEDTSTSRRVLKKAKQQLAENPNNTVVFSNPYVFYKYIGYLFYFSFALTVPSLILYAILMDK